MHILIYLESEFYDTFDGHIYNYVPHRTFGLSGCRTLGSFPKKIEFHVIYMSIDAA